MCISIGVRKDGGDAVLCGSVGELAEELGLPPDEISPDPKDFCLCNAYLEKLGARENPDDWFPEYVIQIGPAAVSDSKGAY